MDQIPYGVELGIPPFDEVVALDALGFGRLRTDETDEMARSVLGGATFGITVRDQEDSRLVGYGVFQDDSLPRSESLYVNALIAEPGYQRGVGRAILAAALGSGKYDYLVFTTQSPSMYRAGQNFTKKLYPSLDGSRTPRRIAAIGRLFTGPNPANYPVRKAVYRGRPLYGTRPDHPLAEQFYAFPGLDYENGDALLCVGRIAVPKPRGWRRFIPLHR